MPSVYARASGPNDIINFSRPYTSIPARFEFLRNFYLSPSLSRPRRRRWTTSSLLFSLALFPFSFHRAKKGRVGDCAAPREVSSLVNSFSREDACGERKKMVISRSLAPASAAFLICVLRAHEKNWLYAKKGVVCWKLPLFHRDIGLRLKTHYGANFVRSRLKVSFWYYNGLPIYLVWSFYMPLNGSANKNKVFALSKGLIYVSQHSCNFTTHSNCE